MTISSQTYAYSKQTPYSPRLCALVHAPNALDALLPFVEVRNYCIPAICTAAVRQGQVLSRNLQVELVSALRLHAVIVRLAAC